MIFRSNRLATLLVVTMIPLLSDLIKSAVISNLANLSHLLMLKMMYLLALEATR